MVRGLSVKYREKNTVHRRKDEMLGINHEEFVVDVRNLNTQKR